MWKKVLTPVIATVLGTVSLTGCIPTTQLKASAAEDPIEPGSVESFLYWAESTGDYVTNVVTDITTGNIAGWAVDTVQYAWDIRSLCLAYQAWFDNQQVPPGQAPQFETISGYIKLSGEGHDDNTITGICATGVVNYSGTQYTSPNHVFWMDSALGHGAGFMSYAESGAGRPNYIEGNGVTTVSLGNNILINGSTVGAAAWQQSYNGNGFAIDFYHNINSDAWAYAWGQYVPHPAAYVPIPFTPKANKPYRISITSPTDILDLFEEIQEQYPDREDDKLPDITPPETDADVDEHPDGCHCVCHVEVNVTVEIPTDWHPEVQFPTYDVTDVPEPSDFDFSIIETLDPSETDPTFSAEDIPEVVVSGAEGWFDIMELFIDTFRIQNVLILLIALATLLYFIWR